VVLQKAVSDFDVEWEFDNFAAQSPSWQSSHGLASFVFVGELFGQNGVVERPGFGVARPVFIAVV
jgi:hypothetical protein